MRVYIRRNDLYRSQEREEVMASGTTVPVVDEDETDTSTSTKTRDARNTQLLLLQAARRRFALDGYSATTVREIAADAGVNVALINRYFGSKEGLFEACLTRAVEGLERLDTGEATVDILLREIVKQASSSFSSERSLQMLILLRSSGDEGAERIRRNTFQDFAERMAATAGWRADDPSTAHLMLRAQLAMSALFGIVLLRATSGLEPLSSATEEDLRGPLVDVLGGFLSPSGGGRDADGDA
jgi:AcrR family transcriptional regulator